MQHGRLAIFDEMSMIGRAFLGKVLYRAAEVSDLGPSQVTLAGMDAILAGHFAQAPPIGDEPLFKQGAYAGKALNKPSKREAAPDAKS